MRSNHTKRIQSHNRIIRLAKLTALFLLLSIALVPISSCTASSSNESVKLSTSYASYSGAATVKLDLSLFSQMSLLDVSLIEDQIIVLLGSSNEYIFAFFDREGNSASYSELISHGENENFYHMYPSADGKILIASGLYVPDADTYEIRYEDVTVTAYNSSGTSMGVQFSIKKDFGTQEPFVETDSKGNLYVRSGKEAVCYTATGKLLFENEYNQLGDIFIIGNTPVASVGLGLYPLTAEKTDSAIVKELAMLGTDAFYESCTDGLFAYNPSGIFAYDFNQKQFMSVLKWNDTDLGYTSGRCRIFILAKDIYLAEVTTNQGTCEYYLLLPGSEPIQSQKKVITIAGMGIDQMSYLYTVLDQFNKENSEYTLQIHDYLSESAGDLDKAKTQMNLDLLTENAADIYMYAEEDIDNHPGDIFLDLNTLIDKDLSFSKEDYFWNILSTCQTDGRLDRICTAFHVNVLKVPQSVAGKRSSWTIGEFMNMENSLPEGMIMFNAGGTQTTLFASLFSSSYDQFFDPVSGKLNLENDTFYKMLDFAGMYAGYIDGSNTPVITEDACARLCGIQSFRDYADIAESGESFSLLGFPTDDDGEIKASMTYYFSIPGNSKNIDAAWKVIKFLLSDEMQKAYMEDQEGGYYGLPVNRKSMDWQIDQFLNPDPSLGGTPITMEMDNSFLGLITGIHSRAIYDSEIMEIAREEVPAYYLGQKSAEDVAKILEERINIRLQEQR